MPTTVYLRATAPRVAVRRGARRVDLEPGAYTDVPDELLDVVLASGAVKRSRPTGQDETDSAADGAEEE